MESNLSQKQLGRRLAELRQFKGMSQQELAQQIGISRSSLAQIELGNRNLHVQELQRLAHLLGFSLDQFLSSNYSLKETLSLKAEKKDEKREMRISTPTLKVDKFVNILLYVLEKCAGKPNVGETLLYKLLYFSDFNYYELYEEHLTGATYHKLPFGPVPQNLHHIIDQMIREGKLKRLKTKYHDYLQTRYIPLLKADLSQLKASEKVVIDRVIEQFSDWSAKAISGYSHKDIPWQVTNDGEEIDYELALYREMPYSVRNYEENNQNDQ